MNDIETIKNLLIIIIILIIAAIITSTKFKGAIGEKRVSSKLDNLDSNKYKVINDVMIKNSNKTKLWTY